MTPYCHYTRLDAQGRTVVSPTLFARNQCYRTAIATDEYGHPHILHPYSGRLWYTILDDRGRPLVADVRMNTVITSDVTGFSPAIAVDRQGNRHVLWYADTPGPGYDLVYTRLISGGLPSPNQITVTRVFTNIDTSQSHRLVIRTDSGRGARHLEGLQARLCLLLAADQPRRQPDRRAAHRDRRGGRGRAGPGFRHRRQRPHPSGGSG